MIPQLFPAPNHSVVPLPTVAHADDAAQRLVDNINAILDREKSKPRQFRKKQKDIAALLGVTPATISQTLKRRDGSTFRLVYLDALADLLGTTPTDLLKRPESTVWELTADEARWVRYYRMWTKDVRATILGLLTYFAGLLPEEREQFRFWSLISPLSEQGRLMVEEAARVALLKEMKRPSLGSVRRSTGTTALPVKPTDSTEPAPKRPVR